MVPVQAVRGADTSRAVMDARPRETLGYFPWLNTVLEFLSDVRIIYIGYPQVFIKISEEWVCDTGF